MGETLFPGHYPTDHPRRPTVAAATLPPSHRKTRGVGRRKAYMGGGGGLARFARRDGEKNGLQANKKNNQFFRVSFFYQW